MPLTEQLLLIGGGHSHALLLKQLFTLPSSQRQSITNVAKLLSSSSTAIYSGMLPRVISGEIPVQQAEIPIQSLCEQLGLEFVNANVEALELPANHVVLDDGTTLSASLYSWNTGLEVDSACCPDSNCSAVRPVTHMLAWWRDCLDALKDKQSSEQVVNIVGGGVASVELALAMDRALRNRNCRQRVSICIVSAADTLLSTMPAAVQRKINAVIAGRDIQLLTDVEVARVDAGALVSTGGQRIPHDFCLWAGARQAPAFFAESGLRVDPTGCIAVDSQLRSVSHPAHFAAGDIASIQPSSHAKNGVYAVRHAPTLLANILAVLQGQRLQHYRPQRHYLALIDLSDGTAIGVRGRWHYHGHLMRWLKNRIDQRFVRQFYDLLDN